MMPSFDRMAQYAVFAEQHLRIVDVSAMIKRIFGGLRCVQSIKFVQNNSSTLYTLTMEAEDSDNLDAGKVQ
jgi:hypothetical protein